MSENVALLSSQKNKVERPSLSIATNTIQTSGAVASSGNIGVYLSSAAGNNVTSNTIRTSGGSSLHGVLIDGTANVNLVQDHLQHGNREKKH